MGWSDEYSARRGKMEVFVRGVLEACGVKSTSLRGSWLYGDFHLRSDLDQSFSDVDLVVTGATEERIAGLAGAIRDRLRPTLKLKVAIHPVDSMELLAVEDARTLLAGEYLISMLQKVPAGLMSADYARAKISLLFLRQACNERYESVMRRIGSDVVARAARVKLGICEPFSSDDMSRCLAGTGDPTIDCFVANCLSMSSMLSSTFLRQWRRDVERARSVNPWLKAFIVRRVDESLTL